jgi:hypothetical protein
LCALLRACALKLVTGVSARPAGACLPCPYREQNGDSSMPKRARKRTRVIGGVDTHRRTHHAAVIDQQGRLLSDREFTATSSGYRQLLSWLRRHGHLDAVGWRAPAATAPA